MSNSGEGRFQRLWRARPLRDVSPFFTTASLLAVSRFRNYFNVCDILWERGLKEHKVVDGSLLRVRLSGWSRFISSPPSLNNITVVREFYSVLSEAASGGEVSIIPLRGVSVAFTPEAINQVLNIPAIDPAAHYEVVWNLGNEESRRAYLSRAVRELFPGHSRVLSLGVTAGDLSRSNREWKRFINSRALIFADSDAVSETEALLLHAIRDHEVDIDWGVLIHREAITFATVMDPGHRIPFSSLIAGLCRLAEVPIHFSDRYA